MKSFLVWIIVGLFISFGVFLDTISNNEKGVYYDNVIASSNVILNNVNGLNIDYSAELNEPGEYYELYFDVHNMYSTDVKITDCIYHEDDYYLSYNLTYEDGVKVQSGDILKKGEIKQLHYKVFYNNFITEDYDEFDSSFQINYEQIL